MVGVQPVNGQSSIVLCMCSSGGHDAGRKPSFGELFELHRAVEELISNAVKDGTEISPDHAVTELRSKGAGLGLSTDEVRDAIVAAAGRAGAAIRSRG